MHACKRTCTHVHYVHVRVHRVQQELELNTQTCVQLCNHICDLNELKASLGQHYAGAHLNTSACRLQT